MGKVYQLPGGRKTSGGGYTGGSDGGEPPMSNLESRVEHLERDVGDIKVTLARIEAKLDNCVTWKAAFAGLAVLLAGLAGIAWWVVQQVLTPLLQAAGAS